MNDRWCESPFAYARRLTREVRVGDVGVGGRNPIRIQSMTTPATTDTEATVAQIVRLAEAGCEIVRLTVPTSADARNLPAIRRELASRKIAVPLVADIHFSPGAALKAVEHVEKIRVNPGNYADRKQFAVREYTDAEYDSELARLAETFLPLVRRAKQLGVAMRIGTNHGSLSDRILNRYGDSPLGMVESALEFVRICEGEDYRDLIISMKSSNPVVTIEAYRLLAARMQAEGMDYPFHLGVTEAGDGADGRIKSAIGIGSLLDDGIGDTVRVSLTEDPVEEIPVARRLVEPYNRMRAEATGRSGGAEIAGLQARPALPFDPFSHARRRTRMVRLGPHAAGGEEPVLVEVRLRAALTESKAVRQEIDSQAGPRVPAETRADLVEARIESLEDVERLASLRATLELVAPGLSLTARPEPRLVPALLASLKAAGTAGRRGAERSVPAGERPEGNRAGGSKGTDSENLADGDSSPLGPSLFGSADRVTLPARDIAGLARDTGLSFEELPQHLGCPILAEGTADELLKLLDSTGHPESRDTRPASEPARSASPVASSADAPASFGSASASTRGSRSPDLRGALAVTIPVRLGAAPHEGPAGQRLDREDTRSRTSGAGTPRLSGAVHEYRRLAAELAERSLDVPILLSCELDAGGPDAPGAELAAAIVLGSLLCDGIGDAVSVATGDASASRALAFNILQAARVRISKTEFISCPSCGRTLFDLEDTTKRIKARTAHLKGLKIAIMGCVVNGPGEMADADFGYVGWGTDKIALFVGKEMVARDIPVAEADDRLVALIKEHGKWREPALSEETAS